MVVKKIPAILATIDIKEMLINIIDILTEIEDILPIKDKVNKILATIAYYGSIKVEKKMKLKEMNELLKQMEKTSYSIQYNYEKLTSIEVKLNNIEKLFQWR
ncbi:MAG: hypothetical protein ACR5KW_00925 [Wolbachia sp.]